MARICLIEDDQQMREQLQLLLERNGYEVIPVTDFHDPVAAIQAAAPQLLLLDLGLPHFDGQFICREVRKSSDVPIIVVTSRNSETDEVLALGQGADDFIPKPYSAQVLLMRIERVLARSTGSSDAQRLSVAGLTLDLPACAVSYKGSSFVNLTKNEFKILALLMRNPGQVLSRARIMEDLWASDEFVDDNTLTVNISHLRQTLASIGAQHSIETRRGLGYVLVD